MLAILPRSVLLGLLLSMALLNEAAAVGPYFENERAPNDPTAAPAPSLKGVVPPAKPPKVDRLVKGRVVKTDGSVYIVRDLIAGQDVQMTVDRDTRMEFAPQIGDQVEVELLSNGNAWSVKLSK
ncbi:MAG TPA: hypothetical protein VGJ57_00030 [Nitrospirales bacterium]|jgi:hypothetical protein